MCWCARREQVDVGSVKGPELESQDLMGEPSITTDSVRQPV